MIKNHLKIAWRNLKKNALFSSINIFGLTVSLAVTILLFLFISHETSFDQKYAAKDRLYRVLTNTTSSSSPSTYANAPAMVAPTAVAEIPEVENAVRFLKHGFGKPAYLNTVDEEFIETGLYYADP